MNSEHYEKYKDLYKSRTKANRQNKLYNIYLRMHERCSQTSNNPNYKTYRERGITVEFNSPHDFIQWALENGYEDGLTIDRIDAYGNYNMDNCRWVTREVNSGRATAKPVVREDGVEYESINEASRQNGVSDVAIRNAIVKNRRSAGYTWKYKCDTIIV